MKILRYFKDVFRLNMIFKVSIYNAIIVGVRALSGLALSKIVALYLGPSGLALIGNFNNFIRTGSGFTAEGYQNATVRYVSEYCKNETKRAKVLATVFQLSIVFSLTIGLILFFLSVPVSEYIFKKSEFSYIIRLIGLGLPFLSFNLLIIYVLNGLENYKKLVVVNVVLNIVTMLIIVISTVSYQLVGALIGIVISPIIVFWINFLLLGSDRHFFLNVFNPKYFSFEVLKNMNTYLIMSVYSTVIVSITFLFIRNLIIENLSVEQAGYWEAMNKISSFYIMFFLSLTSFYLLPRLSKLSDFKSFKEEILSFYKFNIPILMVVFVLIYFSRFLLLRILLSEEFLPTASLFLWQLIGDFISVIAIALVKQFHAKMMVWAYIICNGLLNGIYYILSRYFILLYGLEGVVKAYSLSYLIYLMLVSIFLYRYFKNNN